MFCRYILVAVIYFISGHYITYIKRNGKNIWVIYNDISQKISFVGSNNIIVQSHTYIILCLRII